MKRLAILLLFISSTVVTAQDDLVYVLKQSTVVNTYDLTDPTAVDGKEEVAQKNWKFKVDHDIDKGHIIQFLEWEENTTLNATFHKVTEKVQRERFFFSGTRTVLEEKAPIFFYISNEDFKKVAEEADKKEPAWSFVTGALTIPIKLRPGGSASDEDGNKLRPLDFTGEVNIGLSMGVRLKVKGTNDKIFIIPAVGLNLTSIAIDESTVRNGVIMSKTNASSLTPFTGVILEYDGFQLALMTGWDYIAGRTGENWIYQGKPWYGIGIGYNIFNTKAGKPTNNESE